MNQEERLRASLPSCFSATMLPRVNHPQSADSSPTQSTGCVNGLATKAPILSSSPFESLVNSFMTDRSTQNSRELLRHTMNPRDMPNMLKRQIIPSWQLSTQRQQQSIYSSQSLSMSSALLRKNCGDASRTLTRPPMPFTNTNLKVNNPLKEKCSSPTSDLQRNGQDVRQKYSNYFDKSKSLLDAAELRTQLKQPEAEKHQQPYSNQSQKSFYSDLFTEKTQEEFDTKAPMFMKRKQLEFHSETKTPRVDIKRIIEMVPKRNTNLMQKKQSDVERNLPESSHMASFKRKISGSSASSSTRGLKIQDFQQVKQIGSGRFGKVFLVRHRQTNTIYALKKMSKRMIKGLKMQHQVILQIKLQMYLDYPNITKLYGFFDDIQNIYLIMEYMEEGTLYEKMQNQKKCFNEYQVAQTTLEISRALQALDDKYVAHRDIKPENILISHGLSKLSDFGWSTLCNDRRTTYCATPAYISPEMIEGKDYDQAIDLWCLGVMVYEMVTGKVPFTNPSRRETERQILNVLIWKTQADVSKLTWPENASQHVRDFVENLLKRDPNNRTRAADLLNHQFLKQVLEL